MGKLLQGYTQVPLDINNAKAVQERLDLMDRIITEAMEEIKDVSRRKVRRNTHTRGVEKGNSV